MSQYFIQQINKKRRCLQRRRVIVATCWAIAPLIIGTMLLVGLDRMLGMNDLASRLLCSLAWVVLCVVIGRRWLRAVCRPPVTLLEVAHRVERQYPQLRDRVTSAIDFHGQLPADPYAGSESLRRAVISSTTVAIDVVDWQQLVSWRPVRRAGLAASGALLVVILLAWWTPQALGTGLTRLLNPLSSAAWPRVNDLQFVKPPSLVAAGDDFVVQLLDTRGSLPSAIEMHYRIWRNGRWQYQTHPFTAVDERLEVRRVHVQESFEYRATGGDHSTMPWYHLEVVAPPRVRALQVTVQPPAYTGLPERLLGENMRVFAGSSLAVEGQTDRPLTRVVLRSERGAELPVVLDNDQKTFRLDEDVWHVEASDLFWFELTTQAGLEVRSARQLAIEVVPDKPPRIKFIEPVDDLTVVPEAEVQLVLEAQDDLAARAIDLVYRRSDRSEQGDQVLPLFRGPDLALTVDSSTQRKKLTHLWQLEPLGLKPGSVVDVLARASDYQPATGQTSRSIRLLVVSKRELLRRLGRHEAQILEKISQTLGQQRKLLLRTEGWAKASGRPTEHWLSEGHTALFGQRQITNALTKRPDSVARIVEKILQDINRNRLVQPETESRLQFLENRLDELASGPLPEVEQLLSDWIRQSEHGYDQAQTATLVAAVAIRQEQVIDALQQALDQLGRWSVFQEFERELADLHNDQQQLWESCRHDIAPNSLQANSASERTSAKNAMQHTASQERHLARRFAGWMARLSQSADELSNHESALAVRLDATRGLAQELAIQATMREAADELQQHRPGRAMSLQQQAVDQLQALLHQLAGMAKDEANKKNPGLSSDGQHSQPLAPDRHSDGSSGKAGSKPDTSTVPSIVEDKDFSIEFSAARNLVNDLWGHLPERQRERILQPLQEEFLPKYAAEIEDYFRALAEPDDEQEK